MRLYSKFFNIDLKVEIIRAALSSVFDVKGEYIKKTLCVLVLGLIGFIIFGPIGGSIGGGIGYVIGSSLED